MSSHRGDKVLLEWVVPQSELCSSLFVHLIPLLQIRLVFNLNSISLSL